MNWPASVTFCIWEKDSALREPQFSNPMTNDEILRNTEIRAPKPPIAAPGEFGIRVSDFHWSFEIRPVIDVFFGSVDLP